MPPHSTFDTPTFRNFGEGTPRFEIVKATYHKKHSSMSIGAVEDFRREHLKFDKPKMEVWEALMLMNEIDDASDPDTELSQLDHALQTAEALREAYPDEDWLHLVGLIHDLGKILKHPKFGGQEDWSTVGDTYPVGCAFSSSIPFHEAFTVNPDASDPTYSSENGIYEPGCGLRNVKMAWGHDEYMYEILRRTGTKIPEEGLQIIRLHSFYAWHTSNEYQHLTDDFDRKMLPFVQQFQACDLYSKTEMKYKPEELKEYYGTLIEKYIGCPLQF